MVDKLSRYLMDISYEEYDILVRALYYSLAVEHLTRDEFTIGLRTINRLYGE